MACSLSRSAMLSLLSMICCALAVPKQFFYSKQTAASVLTDPGGCVLSSWKGTDPDGMAG